MNIWKIVCSVLQDVRRWPEAEALGITAGKNYLFMDGKLADTATSGLLYDWGGYKQLVMVNGRPA
ncbi:MAG: hypothetical protein IKM48_02050 [Clostridia bacterium]|nr:hypothetical protein [Clostridia bacterium]